MCAADHFAESNRVVLFSWLNCNLGTMPRCTAANDWCPLLPAALQVMYDYAKAYQSVCGYDFVLLDRPRCDAYVDAMRAFADRELTERIGEEGLRHLRIVAGATIVSAALRFASRFQCCISRRLC
jgi:hypothetical protein